MPTARNADRVANLSATIPVADDEDPWTTEELDGDPRGTHR